MRAHRLSLFAASLSLGCVVVVTAPTSWTPASPDPAVLNLLPASFVPGSGVTDAVLAECDVEHELPEMLARYSPVPVVLASSHEGATRVLTLTVTQMVAPPGGAFTGPKLMNVRGDMQQLGPEGWQTIASFRVRRTTTRGVGTCGMLEVIADAMGRDVRPWLEQPSMDALLGEL